MRGKVSQKSFFFSASLNLCDKNDDHFIETTLVFEEIAEV